MKTETLLLGVGIAIAYFAFKGEEDMPIPAVREDLPPDAASSPNWQVWLQLAQLLATSGFNAYEQIQKAINDNKLAQYNDYVKQAYAAGNTPVSYDMWKAGLRGCAYYPAPVPGVGRSLNRSVCNMQMVA